MVTKVSKGIRRAIAYLRTFIEEVRAAPGDNLCSYIVHGKIDGKPLSEDEKARKIDSPGTSSHQSEPSLRRRTTRTASLDCGFDNRWWTSLFDHLLKPWLWNFSDTSDQTDL